jgi:predicted lipoprotein
MISTKQTSSPGKTSAVVLLCLLAAGCSSDSASTNGGDGGLRAEVLASLGQNVIVPRQQAFASLATSLETALATAATDPNAREAAQEAWRLAIAVWQELEMMQVGPAGSSLTVMGGQDLRARIYSWPILNLCQVDQQTVQEGYDDPDALEGTVGAPLGLWAIEYLLFTEDPDNNCSPLNTINQDGIWEAIADMIPQRRLAYAAALSTLVRRRADELVAVWAPSGGNFIEELVSPTRSGAVYGTAQEGLNAVSDTMFYLDKETKDMKVGEPIGITGCDAERCPEAIESLWAGHSKENIVANLEGFQVLFLGAAPGADGLGYDDLLVDMGAADVSEDMAAAIEDAITATEAIPGTLREAIDANPDAVLAAHAAIRAITDILKSDFLSVLDLEAPDRAAGDND